MKKSILSCFCISNINSSMEKTEPSSGNPAGLIEEFEGNTNEMQELATQLNLPVTVFIQDQIQTPLLRFFYPTCEMPLCIHGSLGAGYLLLKRYQQQSITAVTKNGQSLRLTNKNNDVFLEVNRGQILPISPDLDVINQLLGLKINIVLDKNLPLCVATIGSPKLLIPLKQFDSLAALKPNFYFIKKWSIENGINGLYVYSADVNNKDYDFVARGFNPKGGKNEDAATGVAAGALYEALQTNFNILQGEFMSQPSCIKVYGNNEQLCIGGLVL